MTHLRDTRIWITGASGGIGYALAAAALAAGARVAASARRAEKLGALRQYIPASEAGDAGKSDSPRLLPLAFDVQDADAAKRAGEQIAREWGGLDFAIANAGDCVYIDPQNEWDDNAIRKMIDINYYGACNTAAAALPLLQPPREQAGGQGRRARGCFAAVTSAATLAPLPRGGAYGASKAATAYFVESLRGHYPDIDFCIIEPGFVKTPLTDKNDFPMPTLMSADAAARAILRGLRRRRARIRFPGALIWSLHIIRNLPTRAQQRLLAKMARRV